MSTPLTDYSELCGDDLRDLCRGRGLPARGTMSELRERLRADGARRAAAAATPTPEADPLEPPMITDYGGRTVADLRNLCRERGLSPAGRSGELRERLEADDRLQSAKADARRVASAAETPAACSAAAAMRQRLAEVETSAGQTLAAAHRDVQAAARRLLAARSEGLDLGVYASGLAAALDRAESASADYLSAARRAMAGG